MAEKSNPSRGEEKWSARTIDRRSYLKTVGATGSGLALGGLGVGETAIEPAHAAPTVLDDFEDGDIDEYTGHTSNYTVEQSSELEGSYRLKCSDPYDQLASTSTHGRGYRYSYRFIAGSGSGSKPALLTCIQDGSNPIDSCYWLNPDVSNDKLVLYLRESGSTTELASQAVSSGLSEGVEYRGVLELGSDTVKGVLYDASGTQLAATSEVSDTTYSDGHYGFYTGGGQPAYYDYVTEESLDGGGTGLTSPNGPSVSGGGLVIDNFEDGNLEEYTFRRGSSGTQVVSSPTFHGSYALEITGSGEPELISLNGLENYPSAGTTFVSRFRAEGDAGLIDLAYGIQEIPADDWKNMPGYALQVRFDQEYQGEYLCVLKHNKKDSSTTLESKYAPLSKDQWYKAEINWGRDGSHTATILDSNGNQVVKLGGTDGTWTSGGVGYRVYNNAGALYVDSAVIESCDDSGAGVTVDDFEDGDLSEYDFDRGASGASVVSSPTFNGSKALEISGTNTEMIKTTGLPNEPEAGDVFSYRVRATGGADLVNLTYGVQDHENRYFVRVNFENDNLRLYICENGTSYKLAEQTAGFSLSEDAWYEVEVDWRTNGRHIVTLDTGSDTITVEDTDPTWTSGGIGYDAYLGDGGTVYFDCVTKNSYRSTDVGKVVDDFDDSDLNEYTVVQGSVSTTSSPAYFGSSSLEISGTDTELVSTSELPSYPSAGDRFRARVRATGGASTAKLLYGVQDGNTDERYAITVDFVNDDVGLYYENGSAKTTLAEDTTSCLLPEDEWLRVEVDWRTDGTHTVSLYNDSEDQIGKMSSTNTTLTNGGIGYEATLSSSGGTVHFDHVLVDGLCKRVRSQESDFGPLQDASATVTSTAPLEADVTCTYEDGTTHTHTRTKMSANTYQATDDQARYWICVPDETANCEKRALSRLENSIGGM